MTQEVALTRIANGHALWSVEEAKEVCRAFDIKFDYGLIIRWKNQRDANPTNNPKGIWLNEPDKAGEGVGGKELSDYVLSKFRRVRVQKYYGRGSQASANATALKKYLAI